MAHYYNLYHLTASNNTGYTRGSSPPLHCAYKAECIYRFITLNLNLQSAISCFLIHNHHHGYWISRSLLLRRDFVVHNGESRFHMYVPLQRLPDKHRLGVRNHESDDMESQWRKFRGKGAKGFSFDE